MFEKMFEKALKIEKGLFPIKRVDKNAIGPIRPKLSF